MYQKEICTSSFFILSFFSGCKPARVFIGDACGFFPWLSPSSGRHRGVALLPWQSWSGTRELLLCSTATQPLRRPENVVFSPNSVVNTWGSVTLVSLLFPLVLSTGCFAVFFWALKRNTADFTQDDR